MPAGSKPGERRGGRVKGIPNRASLARQAQIAQEGDTPLDVLIEGMRFHKAIADLAREQPVPDAKLISDALKAAREYAKEAAPYVHPKLATTELVGNPDKPIKHDFAVRFVGTSNE